MKYQPFAFNVLLCFNGANGEILYDNASLAVVYREF